MKCAKENLDWPLMRNNILPCDAQAVIDFLQTEVPILTQSSQVEAFEQEWSCWLGVDFSVLVNSGSSANLLTITALREVYGLGEVIVPDAHLGVRHCICNSVRLQTRLRRYQSTDPRDGPSSGAQ